MINKHELNKLHSLILKDLPQVRSFCSDQGSLVPLFNEKIAFPNLQVLGLEWIDNQVLWNSHRQESSFSVENLTRLVVTRCFKLKYMFPSSLVNFLRQLKYLIVSECGSMEEIISIEEVMLEERMQKMTFPNLENLQLTDLHKLTWFSSGYMIEFPKLRKLLMGRCGKFKTFVANDDTHELTLFDEKVACPMLAEIKLNFMSRLVKIFPTNSLGIFQRLEMLAVHNCSSLEKIYQVKGLNADGLELQLRNLTLWDLSKLKHIWDKDPQGKLRFPNLRTVFVYDCRRLKNVFPFSIARSDLFQLEKLQLLNCDLEEIVAEGENDEAANLRFVFPRLTSLQLTRLHKLRSFYGKGIHNFTWELPMLKALEAYDCDNVKLFGTDRFLDLNQSQVNDSAKSTILMVEKILPKVEKLILNGKDASSSILWRCPFPSNFFSTLKILRLLRFENGISDVIQCGFPQKLTNLKQLELHECSLQELNLAEGLMEKEDHSRMPFPKLNSLYLQWVNHLRHIWGGNPKLFLIPPQTIRSLTVGSCRSVVSLATSYVSLENLTYLKVFECDALLFLITSSTAKSLVQLVKLEVTYCRRATQIVTEHEEDEVADEVIFTKLEHVLLQDLDDLTSFYPGNRILKFPSLKKLIVRRCSKMETFSHGALSTPKLRGEVYLDEKTKFSWEGNLNTTIRKMFNI